MVTDPRGKFLYVTNIAKVGQNGSIVGYRIDARSGTLSPLPTSPFGLWRQSGNDLTVTPDGAYLYATGFSTKSVSGYAIDRDTGSLWPLPGSPFAVGDFPEGIVSRCRR
jgi:6-phosphogluconolactonase (cycloisomerase 2 family)